MILQGDHTRGEFYSVAFTNNAMQADTGTKMVHLGNNTTSRIVSKGISSDRSINSYRGLVSIAPKAKNARNYTVCDSMLIGSESKANTYPSIEVKNKSATVEHEASTSKISAEELFTLNRGESMKSRLLVFCSTDFVKKSSTNCLWSFLLRPLSFLR